LVGANEQLDIAGIIYIGGIFMTLPQHAYFRGNFVPYSKAKLGLLTHSLNYGTAAFGGLRGYWNDEQKQLFIFRPIDHYKRLLNSAKLLAMEFDYTPEDLTSLTIKLMQLENHNYTI
jgi:branched-chain amino acid aminotransferase